jgi:hypothetical protein
MLLLKYLIDNMLEEVFFLNKILKQIRKTNYNKLNIKDKKY